MADYRLKFMLFNHEGFTVFIIFEQHMLFTSTTYYGDYEFTYSNLSIGSVSFTDIMHNRICLKGVSDYTKKITGAVYGVTSFNVELGIETLINWSKNAKEFVSLSVFEPYIVDVHEDVKKFIFPHIYASRDITFTAEEEELISQYASYV